MSRVSNKPYFVYVLWSASAHRFYIGISENPEQRLEQHNQGMTRWSARHRPWILAHVEQFGDYKAARLRENELKGQKGGRGFFAKTGLEAEQFGRGS